MSTLGRDLGSAPQHPLQPLTDRSLKLASVSDSCMTFVEIKIGSAAPWMLRVLNKRIVWIKMAV